MPSRFIVLAAICTLALLGCGSSADESQHPSGNDGGVPDGSAPDGTTLDSGGDAAGDCGTAGDASVGPNVTLPAACAVSAAQVCNPLDATGCNAGDTCDLASDGTFDCFPTPDAAKLGDACDGRSGPFCDAGLTCVGAPGTARCAKLCCAASECASGEACTPLATAGASHGNVGSCTDGSADGGDAGADPIIGHHVGKLQGRGRLVPWTSWNDALDREMKWYATTCPAFGGYPLFASATHVDDTCAVTGVEVIAAMQDGVGILSYLKYYVRGGRKDAALLAYARALGDYIVKEALTPDDGLYPRFPRSTGKAQAMPQAANCGTRSDLPYEIEPDKGGIAGYALVELGKETNDASYLDAALQTAHVLAATMAAGDASTSPWPFRVDYRDGTARGDVSGDMAYILRLFDELLASGHNELAEPRAKLWTWIKQHQIPSAKGDGKLWAQFFEDQIFPTQRTAWAPLNLARYLLEKQCALDPEWEEDTQILLDFVENNFVDDAQGFRVCIEQDFDRKPYGGILSTYGAVSAMHARATGSPHSRRQAYTALNLLIFGIDNDGCPADRALGGQRGGWQEDAHFDKIHNFMDALAAFPGWAD